MSAANKLILVTGDPICDHNYYKGKRQTADSEERRGFRYYRKGGGALLLKDLIAATMAGEKEWTTEFGLNPDYETLPLAYHSFCLWEPQAGGAEKPKTECWRAVEPPLGYGHPSDLLSGNGTKLRTDAYAPRPTPLGDTPAIVVIDDAGLGFRDASRRTLWAFGRNGGKRQCPDWIVLKLTGPIGKSALWDEITSQCKDNLVVIVPAEELRRRAVRLSRGLSWEATAADLAAELQGNPLLAPLRKARHLIVTFQSDGAFWLDNKPEAITSMLVFDAARAEGEWSERQGKGGAFGYLSCFTAAVVRALCLAQDKHQPDLEAALAAGLGASRELRRIGHGKVMVEKEEPTPGFPIREIVAEIRQPVGKFVSALIPGSGRARGGWMMLDEWQVHAGSLNKPRPYYDAALAVAMLGPDALERFPVAEFGTYETVDRREIESLRTFRQLINDYNHDPRPKTPLNLGVFGPPGAGKSYIVIEIAKAVLGIEEADVLLFNLSQFSEPADLFGAFHRVRDKVLSGATPLVFWDEFDAKGYKWLQYLLAPMEDGFFQDGQITHPIGKCIFVFAGATSSTFDKFGPCNPDRLPKEDLARLMVRPEELRAVEQLWREFVLAKGPDFKSRLVGYLNILGVNQRLICSEKDGRRRWENDATDLCFPIRRAFFIRALFKARKGQRLKLELGVLRALLEIPTLKGAGRSLQFICKHLRQQPGIPGRSGLPGYELLDMHVHADEFWRLCERDMEFAPAALALAQGLHEDWLASLKPEQRAENTNARPWDEIDPDTRGSNIAQAARIPSIVALAGLRVVPGKPVSVAEAKHIADTLEAHSEILAEAEHNGWMVERMLAGWRYGRLVKKDPVKKLHPLLIPYAQLHQVEKEKDRRVVKGEKGKGIGPEVPNYLERVQRVGFRIEPTPLA